MFNCCGYCKKDKRKWEPSYQKSFYCSSCKKTYNNYIKYKDHLKKCQNKYFLI